MSIAYCANTGGSTIGNSADGWCPSVHCSVALRSELRLREAMQLRIKDLDFPQHQIIVRDAKGQESRVTMLPNSLIDALEEHLQRFKQIHQQDLEQGYGAVILAFALANKYPSANRQWIWQFVFPASTRCRDPLQNGYDIRTVQELLGSRF